MSFPFIGYVEYLRIFSVQHITSDGMYKENQVPEDYRGSVLTAEVVHRVVLVSPNGELIKLDFNVPEAQDADGERSGGITRDGAIIQPGDNPTVQLTRNSDQLPETLQLAGDAMFDVAESSAAEEAEEA